MAQQFQRSVAQNGAAPTVHHDAPLVVVETVPMTPPYGESAAIVAGQLTIAFGADIASVTIELVRNADVDNVLIGLVEVNVTAPAGQVVYSVMGVDQIPDGRDVKYAMRVTTTGGVDDCTASNPVVDATLLSGAKGQGGF